MFLNLVWKSKFWYCDNTKGEEAGRERRERKQEEQREELELITKIINRLVSPPQVVYSAVVQQ